MKRAASPRVAGVWIVSRTPFASEWSERAVENARAFDVRIHEAEVGAARIARSVTATTAFRRNASVGRRRSEVVSGEVVAESAASSDRAPPAGRREVRLVGLLR